MLSIVLSELNITGEFCNGVMSESHSLREGEEVIHLPCFTDV